jgi:site-specific recombinase XerD
VTPHTFRHSLLRRLLDQGVELPKVQAIAGHSSLRVTGMYLTPHEGTRRSAIERGANLRTT